MRRCRRCSALASATARRRLRSEPVYPSARQSGSRRLALMRPSVASTFLAMSSRTGRCCVAGPVARSPAASGARRPGGRSCGSCRRALRWHDSYRVGIGGEDVQLFPRSLHNGRPSGFAGGGLTSPLCDPGASPGGQDRSRGGDFLVAISGDFTWPLAGSDRCHHRLAGKRWVTRDAPGRPHRPTPSSALRDRAEPCLCSGYVVGVYAVDDLAARRVADETLVVFAQVLRHSAPRSSGARLRSRSRRSVPSWTTAR